MISKDLLWKGIIRDLFEDFLLLFFPAFAPLFDFSKGFEFLEQELAQLMPEADSKRRVADLLVKVHLLDGSEQWFLIHLEIQGYPDPQFPERMFVYFYRIRDRFDQRVVQLAILTDDEEDYHPTHFHEECMGTKTRHEFKCVKLAKLAPEDFKDRRNIFNIVLETAWLGLKKNRKNDEAVFNHALRLQRRLLGGGFPKDKIRRVLKFLEHVVTFGKPEFKEKLKQEIHQTKEAMGIEEIILEHYKEEARQEGRQEGEKLGIEKGEKLGIEKGEKLGIEKGIRLSVEKMLLKNFQPEFIAEVLSVGLAVILQVQKELVGKNGKSEK